MIGKVKLGNFNLNKGIARMENSKNYYVTRSRKKFVTDESRNKIDLKILIRRMSCYRYLHNQQQQKYTCWWIIKYRFFVASSKETYPSSQNNIEISNRFICYCSVQMEFWQKCIFAYASIFKTLCSSQICTIFLSLPMEKVINEQS